MDQKIKVFGIVGSLRSGSFNKSVMEAVKENTSDLIDLDVFDRLAEIPPFNQDQEKELPEIVKNLKERIRNADAVIIVTPEYNYSFPGILKNSIDWASRPYGDNAWEGKPVALMTASPGTIGGARAQYQLRQVFVFLNMHPLNKPEIIIPEIEKKINANGVLTDEKTKAKIREQVEALVEWTAQLMVTPAEAEKLLEEKYPYERAYGKYKNGTEGEK